MIEAVLRETLKSRRPSAAWSVTASGVSLTRIGAAAACYLSATLHDRCPIELTRHLAFADSPVKGGFEICGGRAIIGLPPL
jgi:hypothetical protein